jgi:hypothetical protein
MDTIKTKHGFVRREDIPLIVRESLFSQNCRVAVIVLVSLLVIWLCIPKIGGWQEYQAAEHRLEIRHDRIKGQYIRIYSNVPTPIPVLNIVVNGHTLPKQHSFSKTGYSVEADLGREEIISHIMIQAYPGLDNVDLHRLSLCNIMIKDGMGKKVWASENYLLPIAENILTLSK